MFEPSGPKVKMGKCFVASHSPVVTGNPEIAFTSAPVVLKQPLPIPHPGVDLVFDDAPATRAVAKRARFLENMQLLCDSGLKSQHAFDVTRLATTGDLNYLAQCQPIRHSQVEELDVSLYQSSLALLNIDSAEP